MLKFSTEILAPKKLEFSCLRNLLTMRFLTLTSQAFRYFFLNGNKGNPKNSWNNKQNIHQDSNYSEILHTFEFWKFEKTTLLPRKTCFISLGLQNRDSPLKESNRNQFYFFVLEKIKIEKARYFLMVIIQ